MSTQSLAMHNLWLLEGAGNIWATDMKLIFAATDR
jgi:hypothetical protein